jgi:alkylhydroperoxidase family enzyme
MDHAAKWTGAVRESKPIPSHLLSYAETITRDAVEITDGDVASLKEHGHSEHEIFEFTIAASAGAGIARLELGWQALADALATLPGL